MKENLTILDAVGGDATDTAMQRMILARDLPKRTIALILAGGRGSRLYELTDRCRAPIRPGEPVAEHGDLPSVAIRHDNDHLRRREISL